MRQRITFLHQPQDAIDPQTIAITGNSLVLAGLRAAREDRVTFGFEELPKAICDVLKESHELHIRYVNRISYDSISPLVSRVSPGLHVYYSPQRNRKDPDTLCPLLNQIFSPKSHQLCQSPEISFTSLPAQRFQHSTAFEYYLPQSHYDKHALVSYILQICPASNKSCLDQVARLRDAAYIDFDFDTISHTLGITAFWASKTWDLSLSPFNSHNPQDRLEIGLLSNEKPVELEELSLGGFLTIVGEDSKPAPALFSFPARHHPLLSFSFSATFIKPTGLHPSLQLRISDSKPPAGHKTCALHAHLTLPRVVFADKYQLSDPLFLASKNLSAIRYITQPVDLEAPEWAMSLWGSSLLLELAPPSFSLPTSSDASASSGPWTAEVPLHLRYLPPTPSGHSLAQIPYPVLFWACVADEGSKFSINPFDRVNLGYDGLFGPRTMFYHLDPVLAKEDETSAETVAGTQVADDGYVVVDVPVLQAGHEKMLEWGTAAVIFLGFSWVMWKLFEVWRVEGYGRYREPGGDGEQKKETNTKKDQ